MRPSSSTALETGWRAAWRGFWFTPVDPLSLHVVRMLTGGLLLLWLLPLAGEVENFYGFSGWLDRQAYVEADRQKEILPKPLTWSIVYLCGDNATALQAAYWLSIAVIGLFTLGLATRVTSVLTWVVVASFTANPVLDYDADPLLLMLTLYLMIGYVLLWQRDLRQSLATRLLGSLATLGWGRSDQSRPSIAANLALRLIQVHFSLIMVATGLHKLQFGDWWAGVAMWFAMFPPFDATLADVRRQVTNPEGVLRLLSAASYVMLAWQLAFPFFAWRRQWRWLLLTGGVIGLIGCAYLYAMPLLGPAFLIGCLSFVRPEEWRWLLDKLPERSSQRGSQTSAPLLQAASSERRRA